MYSPWFPPQEKRLHGLFLQNQFTTIIDRENYADILQEQTNYQTNLDSSY